MCFYRIPQEIFQTYTRARSVNLSVEIDEKGSISQGCDWPNPRIGFLSLYMHMRSLVVRLFRVGARAGVEKSYEILLRQSFYTEIA